MITELVIENFKAFGESQRAELAPITLIFGGNSAGKSSLLQALLLLRQTLVPQDRFGPPRRSSAELVVRGEFVDLGSFDALVHRHERDRPVRVGWGFRPSEHHVVRRDRAVPIPEKATLTVSFRRPRWGEAIEQGASELRCDGASIELMPPRPGQPEARLADPFARGRGDPVLILPDSDATLQLLQWTGNAQAGDFEIGDGLTLASLPELGVRAILGAQQGIPASFLGFAARDGRSWAVADWQSTLFDTETPREVSKKVRESMDGWLRQLGTAARSTLTRVQYLGPMRSAPERLNILTGERVTGVGTRGEHVVDQLARRADILSKVNEWFVKLDIPYEAEVRTVTDEAVAGAIGEVHCLLLRSVFTGVEVAPTDVGFGIGQVLPVVVQSILTTGNVLCIEQPEIHLHPALQARLGNLFAEQIRRPNSRSNQFILETHSEHLILRLQRLIRSGYLRSEQVSVLHVGRGFEGEAELRRLRLDEEGSFLDEWPEGFFEERYQELFED